MTVATPVYEVTAAETLGIDIEVTPLPEEERAAEAAAAEAEADLEAHLAESEANAQATEEVAERALAHLDLSRDHRKMASFYVSNKYLYSFNAC